MTTGTNPRSNHLLSHPGARTTARRRVPHPTAALLALLALSALLGGATPARAQFSSGMVASTSGSDCTTTNNQNRYCGYSIDELERTDWTFESAYRWNINADAPLFESDRAAGTAQHAIFVSIKTDRDAWYELQVDQRWKFHYSLGEPATDIDFDSSFSGMTAAHTGSLTLVSGSLDIDTDFSSLSDDHANDTSATAVYRLQGTGRVVTFFLTFTWTGAVRSKSIPVAFRMGQTNETTESCDECGYPGDPSRVQADDGHFVTLTLAKLCGNGVVDTDLGEECDGGSCCDPDTCTPDASLCGDGNDCTTDSCAVLGDGSAACVGAPVANGTACDDGLFCNGDDTCQQGECLVHGTDPCAGNLGDADADCSESCDESTDSCTARDTNGSACDDGLFCTESDTCFNGGCLGLGTPCAGAVGDGDADCSESCDESTRSCTANDAEGVPCSDGLYCDGEDSCDGAGNCSAHTGDPCAGRAGDGDADCSESCNEASASCSGADPAGTSCSDGLWCDGTDTCDGSGGCTQHTGDPCPGADGDTNCRESCDESSDSCDAADPDGSTCRPGSDATCDPSETCSAGVCAPDTKAAAGTPCSDGNACDGDEACDGLGSCAAGEALDCDDRDLCTQDGCDPDAGCVNDARPATSCFAVARGTLRIDERRSGQETLLAKFLGAPPLAQTELGDPLAYPGTSYAVCLYDARGDLAGALAIDRAGLTCSDGRAACWTPLGDNPPDGLGWKYADRAAGEDGVTGLRLRADGHGPASAVLRARNDAARGLDAYPTGIAAALDGHSRATMQMMSSDGACLSAELERSGPSRPDVFRGHVD